MGLAGNFTVCSFNHPCRHAVPYIGHRIELDTQAELVQLLIKGSQPVIQGPKGLTALCSSKHILRASLGNSLPESRIDGNQFCGRLDIEVVHTHTGDNTLWIVTDSLFEVTETDEDTDSVIIERRTCLQGRGVAVNSLQVAVILLLPLTDLRELGSYRVLEKGCLLLIVYF